MNPQMRLVFMLGVMTATGSILFAAEPKQPASAAGEQPEPAATAPTASAQKSAQPAAQDDTAPPQKSTGAAADSKGVAQRFTPSEQVRADFPVSFPIDI